MVANDLDLSCRLHAYIPHKIDDWSVISPNQVEFWCDRGLCCKDTEV